MAESEKNEKKVTIDNETLFVKAYKQTEFSSSSFQEAANHAFERIINIALIPEADVIHNCEVFSIPDFLENVSRERDSQLFFDATMAIGELLCILQLLQERAQKDRTLPVTSAVDEINKQIFSEKRNIKDSQRCKLLFNIIHAAASIVKCNIDEKVKTDAIKEYFDEKTIQFLTDIVLVQKSLCQSRAFRAFIEIIGKMFIVNMICRIESANNVKPYPNSLEVITYLINSEKTQANSKKPTKEYQTYLNFVKTVCTLYDDPQLSYLLQNTEIIVKAADFGFPPFFCAFVDFLTSIIKSPQLASYVFDYIKNSPSDILKFQNFFNAISEHTSDFMQCEIDRQKLDAKDTLGLESVLRLISALCVHKPKYIAMFTSSELFKSYHLVNSLIMYTLSPVPASLKAECFNCLSALKLNLWPQIKATKILTEDMIETHKGGIISDIQNIEAPAQLFSIPAALANLIASMLQIEDANPDNFALFHRFLDEEVLRKLKTWKYLYIDIKWRTLRAVCEAWISALRRENWLDVCMPLFRTALTDPFFVSELLHQTNEEGCPIECLRSIYTLLLMLLQKEKGFLHKALSSNEPCAAAMVNLISRDSNAVIKMLRCVVSSFRDIQIISLRLIEFLATASPLIVQILLTKPSAKAIQICCSVLDLDESEEKGDISQNVRCLLLDILYKLGSASYFVRHVCGFDQHDPPNSIMQSTLETGIFVLLTKKLCIAETHKNYPIFVAKSLRVLLLECKQDLTINSTLNLLRSSLHSFFITQLKYLTSISSSRIAIGCFLQILAREAMNSSQTASLSGITCDSFNYLMTTQIDLGESKRNVLILDFIDRVENDSESKYILRGVNDLTVAYLNSNSIISLMKENDYAWPATWFQTIFLLLEKLQRLTNSKLTGQIAGTCAIISNAILTEKKFGDAKIKDLKLKKLFTVSLNTIVQLVDIGHVIPRISIYSLLNSVACSLKPDEKLINIFQPLERQILRAAMIDSESEIPILRSASFSVIESLIPYATNDIFFPFLIKTISQTESDWRLFEIDPKAAAFCMSSKCHLYSKFITLSKNPIIGCRSFLDEGLIIRLSYEPFWSDLVNMISNISTFEMKIQTAADILSFFALMSIAFHESEDLRIQIRHFFRDFHRVIIAALTHGGYITLTTIEFFTSFVKLLSSIPNVEDLQEVEIWNHVPFIFRRFANEDEWRSAMRMGNDSQTLEKAKNKVTNLLMYGIYILSQMAEKRDIFTAPLFGEEWRAKYSVVRRKEGDMPSLSVVTSYLTKLLKDIKEGDQKEKSVASAGLVLVWWHINRWEKGPVHFDLGVMKRQAEAFTLEPYSTYSFGTPIDNMILKKLAKFSTE